MTLSAVGLNLSGRLDGVSLKLDPGQLTVVIGPNGAGKSSLIRVLAGLLPVDAGTVSIAGRPMASLPRVERAASVAWLPQHPRVEVGLRAWEVVAAARYRFAEPWTASRARALERLGELGVGDLAERPMERLSGGEAQRVRLASLSAQEAAWWLLDEPANHLDPAVRLELVEEVLRQVSTGTGVVLVTHDLGLLARAPRARVVAMSQGCTHWDGRADAPELPEVLGGIFGITLSSVEDDGRRHLVIR